MRQTQELISLPRKAMFLLFCVFLLAGSLTEGFPVTRERYQRIRCRPGDNSIACFQEQSLFEQGQISNKIDSNPVVKKTPTFVEHSSFSEEDNGSGNGVFSGEEPNSSKEYGSESNEVREYKLLKNLSGENLLY
ncbi:serglycin [Hyperolius riggenbachi]|uniref:serglycin n=1 Tax=Hyperolius riggenbachi TaxID=752182 RepID=UPI0035A2AEC5